MDYDSDDDRAKYKSQGARRQANASAYAARTEQRGAFKVYKAKWHEFKENYLRPRVTVGGYDNPDYSFTPDGTVLVAPANSTDFTRTDQNIYQMGIPDLGVYFDFGRKKSAEDDEKEEKQPESKSETADDGFDSIAEGIRQYIALEKGGNGEFLVFLKQLVEFCMTPENLAGVRVLFTQYRAKQFLENAIAARRTFKAVKAIKAATGLAGSFWVEEK